MPVEALRRNPALVRPLQMTLASWLELMTTTTMTTMTMTMMMMMMMMVMMMMTMSMM